MELSVSGVLFLGSINTGVVLVALQVIPYLHKFFGVELMGRYQVAVLTTGIRDAPMVEEELIGRGCWVNA